MPTGTPTARLPPALPCKRDRFGLRTRRIHAATLFRDVAEELGRRADERETPAARAYVEAALRSPYWGLRVLAIRVIVAWGGRRNKAWLMERAGRRTSPGRSVDRLLRWRDLETVTARQGLASLLTIEDGPWLLDAWFADAGRSFHGISYRLGLVPEALIEVRLDQEMTSSDADRRLGALRLVAAHRGLTCGTRVIRGRLEDTDPDVRGLARALLRQFIAAEAARARSDLPPAGSRAR